MDMLFNLPSVDPNVDYKRHNEEVKQVWDAFHRGDPIRVPMTLGVNPRVLLCNPKYNPRGISFEDYWNDPDIMLEVQCEFAYYRDHFLFYDHNMGLPNEWWIGVDPQNFGEAAWLGAPLKFIPGDTPDTTVPLNDDNREMLFEKGIPDPFSGVMGRIRDYYEYFNNGKHTFMGRPVKAGRGMLGTDGPMTIACSLRGATEFCIELYEDPDYAMQLLEFITEATIMRIRAWRDYYGLGTPDGMYIADDSIALLSVKDYKRFILPFHKRIISELTTGKGTNQIHLCGDATRHFKTIRDELNVRYYDTGFPVEHGKICSELGDGVIVYGGPRIDILKSGTAEEIENETRRILEDVIPVSKSFVIRDANNLAPGTSPENIQIMYDTVKKYGIYKK